jgi:hypothetical protein
LFAEWKRQIYRLAERHAAQGTNIEVWDFSGISSETLETIPAPGDRTTHLDYYWEAGHFKKELGERIIARLMGSENGFGTKLEGRTLESWLDNDRAQVKALLRRPSPLVESIERLVPFSDHIDPAL